MDIFFNTFFQFDIMWTITFVTRPMCHFTTMSTFSCTVTKKDFLLSPLSGFWQSRTPYQLETSTAAGELICPLIKLNLCNIRIKPWPRR